MPALEANELDRLITASAYPYLDAAEQRKVARRITQATGQRQRPPRYELIEHDPVKAAAWFRAAGAKVKH